MRILFSRKPEWENALTTGLWSLSHDLIFADLAAVSLSDYDLIVPLTVPDVLYLAERRSQVAHSPLAIPSAASVKLCDDKALFNHALMDSPFVGLIPSTDEGLPSPYILKKRIDEWGKHSHVIKDAEQEQELASLLAHPAYFRQALVPGPVEYATHILFQEQRIICALNVRYAFGSATPIKGKDAILSTSLCDCPHLGLFAEILRFLGFEGLCCVNYKELDSRPFLFEINPRFGGSLCPFFSLFLRYLC